MAKGRDKKEPSSPRMDAVWAKFEQGDVLGARRGAKALLADQPSDAERADAQELLARTAVPRLAFALAAVAATLILLLILLAHLRT